MRTLRKTVRIFELRDGKTQGDQSHLYEDTVRILRLLGEPRPSHPEIFLRGDFVEGRDGIYFEYDGKQFDPAVLGRNFSTKLIEQVLADQDNYNQVNFFIEASTVVFPDDENARFVSSISRQLRLIDIYERLLMRALVLKGAAKAGSDEFISFRSTNR